MYILIKPADKYEVTTRDRAKGYLTKEEAQEAADFMNSYEFKTAAESAIGAAPAKGGASKKHRDEGNEKLLRKLRRPK